MEYPTPTKTTRQQDRRALRARAIRTLLGFMGRTISRPDRRLVARAYANGAYRLSQGLPQLTTGKYTQFRGKPVVLNEAMLTFIAFGDQTPPKPAEVPDGPR